MRFLYIFPHPDDEAFGPAGAMHLQAQQGHEVDLLTLTKGEATRIRFELGYSKPEMAAVRVKELRDSASVLGVKELRILDLPDSGLKEMDPREIEAIVEKQISELRPNIVVTYPVHGISGFHDHLVTHAVVKRVFLSMRDAGATYLRRLAFLTLGEYSAVKLKDSKFKLNISPAELIDCIVSLSRENYAAFRQSLSCYKTYAKTIRESGVEKIVGDQICFEIFGESHDPPLKDLAESLPG